MFGSFAKILESQTFKDFSVLIGRILLALPFPIFGVNKFINSTQMMAVVETAGVPGYFLYFIIPYQILCGFAVWIGFQTRWASFLLGGFCIVAPCLYHNNWDLPGEFSMFIKDFATAGGFLLLWRFGPGRFSVDALRSNPRRHIDRA